MKDGINISTELATTDLPKSAIEIELEKLSAKVANLTARVESLNAIRTVAKEDGEEEFEKPVKVVLGDRCYMVTLSKNETKSLGEPAKEAYTHQEINEKFDKAKCEVMGGENKKDEKISFEPADPSLFKNEEVYYKGKPLKDFLPCKLVLRDTVKQEVEDLAQAHEKMLKALFQVELDGMDYHMIKEMVKYIDILHSVRCSAERVASILTKD